MVGEEQFKVTISNEEGKTVVNLIGVIDEDAKFDEISGQSGTIVINFKEISGINSCGVRNWVNFIKTLSGQEVHYANCPPTVVKQMNMIPSFVAHAKVDSVFVPYVCDNCDNEKLELVSVDKFGSVQEVMKCEKCGQEELELDGHPQQYFAFGAQLQKAG